MYFHFLRICILHICFFEKNKIIFEVKVRTLVDGLGLLPENILYNILNTSELIKGTLFRKKMIKIYKNKNQEKMLKKHNMIVAFCVLMAISACTSNHQVGNQIDTAQKVEIGQKDGRFNLLVEGEPYFIKGAVGWTRLDELAQAGANSLRSKISLLDEAHELGFSMLVNLPMGSERNGFDYDNEEAVREQFEKVKKIVEEHKDHPAVLMWSIGNELDHIPGDLDYNLKVWDAVNDIAGMIKEIDPNHLVMTVVGYGKLEKIKDIIEKCPNLDLLGINAYANIMNVPEWLRKYNWTKPYVVTEWGPSGWWEVPKTKWGVVIEETSTEKAAVYKERYEKIILDDSLCVGSYVFLWTSNRQERTHTWFNMFHDDQRTQTIEVMQKLWSGKEPENKAPRIHGLMINGKNALDNVTLNSGSINKAEVIASDPDKDELKIDWELLPEPTKFGTYAGQGEVKPEGVKGFIKEQQNGQIEFEVPADEEINYRLFVYINDKQGNIATANIPFFVTVKP